MMQCQPHPFSCRETDRPADLQEGRERESESQRGLRGARNEVDFQTDTRTVPKSKKSIKLERKSTEAEGQINWLTPRQTERMSQRESRGTEKKVSAHV